MSARMGTASDFALIPLQALRDPKPFRAAMQQAEGQ